MVPLLKVVDSSYREMDSDKPHAETIYIKDALGKPLVKCIKNILLKPITNLLDTSKPEVNTFSKTLESIDKHGKRQWLEITVKGIKSSKGIVEEYIGTIVNFTNLKCTEFELIKERGKEVKAHKAKSEFLSTLSHEIRTPLNAVIEITHIHLIENSKKEQIENLSTLKYSSEQLLGVVNNILNYDKIASGALELEEANFSLKQVLNTVQSVFTHKASKKGIQFKIKKDTLLQDSVIGDSRRLYHVLTNLISNAITFTGEGIVELEVKVINETKNTSKLLFAVTDTGIGIRNNKTAKIFKYFAQAPVSTAQFYGRTGFDITICQRLLELMGTTITMESTYNVGSSFSFELNLKKGNPIASIFEEGSQFKIGTESDCVKNSLYGNKILVVEDNKINILLIEKFLKKWGVDYDIAMNGKLAVQSAFIKKYDLILMDIQMPVMNGLDACMAIRTSGNFHNKTIPIYALSASMGESIKKNLSDYGIDGLICKPFNANDLFATILKILNNKVKTKL